MYHIYAGIKHLFVNKYIIQMYSHYWTLINILHQFRTLKILSSSWGRERDRLYPGFLGDFLWLLFLTVWLFFSCKINKTCCSVAMHTGHTWKTFLSDGVVAGILLVWKTKFLDELKLTDILAATDEDNLDSSVLLRFKNDPQEC